MELPARPGQRLAHPQQRRHLHGAGRPGVRHGEPDGKAEDGPPDDAEAEEDAAAGQQAAASGHNGYRYRDNPNVLFEAGMLHALTGIDYSGGWTPVREQNAPPPPFDVANQNHVIVPRNDDASLDRPAFEEQLCGYIRELLSTDGGESDTSA